MASRGPRKPESKEVRFSKAMTYILRHGAEKEGIQMTKGYYYCLIFKFESLI